MIKKILLISLACLMMVGCSSDHDANEKPKAKFTRYPAGNWYYYLVDENTDIVYLSYAVGNAFGITELYDKDGSLMTADKLGLRSSE